MKNAILCMNTGIVHVMSLLFCLITDVSIAQTLGPQVPNDSVKLLSMRSSGTETGYVPQIPNVLLPSPISQNFTRYTNLTPSLSTGTVNVPIPLYDLKVGELELPIMLQYATNGIKVYDLPYPVGYGWSLQPAFRITRVVLGRDDTRYTRTEPAPHFNPSEKSNIYFESIMGNVVNKLDSQHDIFTVYLPKESFKFIVDWDEMQQQYVATSVGTNAQIFIRTRGRHGDIEEIQILDENNVRYIFGNIFGVSGGTVSLTENTIDGSITTWGLSQIISPNEQTCLKFHWQHKLYDNEIYCKEIYTFREAVNDSESNYLRASSSAGPAPLIYSPDYYKRYIVLDKIECYVNPINGGSGQMLLSEISYKYDSPLSENLLTQITVKENLSGKVVKEIKFTYLGKYNNIILKWLNISGEGTYTFQYYLNEFVSYSTMTGRDYWGFFNGKKADAPQVPKTKVKSNSGTNSYEFDMGASDMEPDETYVQTNLLTKITYPSGGYSEFEYEIHRFDGRTQSAFTYPIPSFTKGGGVRIKKIISSPGDNQKAIVKEYFYGAGENGKGISVAEPTRDTFFNVEVIHYYRDGSNFRSIHNDCRLITLNSFSSYMDCLILGQPVIWYDEVNEYINNQEKTTYKFQFDTYARYNEYRSFDMPIYYWRNVPTWAPSVKDYPGFMNTVSSPLLKEKIIYKLEDAYIPVEKTSYKYDIIATSRKELKVIRNIIEAEENREGQFRYDPYGKIIFPGAKWPLFYSLPNDKVYSGDVWTLYLAKEYLTETNTVKYENNDSIRFRTTYEYIDGYGQKNVKVLKRKTIENNTAENFEEVYLYPWENLSELSIEQKKDMTYMYTRKNKTGTPIRLQQFINNQLIAQKVTQYKYYCDNPDEDTGCHLIPEREYYKVGNNIEECRLSYDYYDQYQNPLCITLDGIPTIYLWSYNGQYPIAEIKNATYEEVEQAVRSAFGVYSLNALSCSTYTAADRSKLLSSFKKLREHPSLKWAQVTGYTYLPMVGISSVTGPSGKTIMYEYDDDNRLHKIIDNDGNLMQKFYYQIINP